MLQNDHKYYLTDLGLKQTVTLPELQALETSETNDGGPPIPPRPLFLIEGDELFVLEMRFVHKYKLPSLEFVKTVTLPEPDLP